LALSFKAGNTNKVISLSLATLTQRHSKQVARIRTYTHTHAGAASEAETKRKETRFFICAIF